MRIIVPLSILLLLLALLLPLFFVMGPEQDAGTAPAPDGDTPPEETGESGPLQYALDDTVPAGQLDTGLTLQVLVDETVEEMTMSAYLQGVLAAEMPASFELEALKAQAVAARTYTLHHMLTEPSARHPQAHVCGDFRCCSAYKTPEALKEQWGEEYGENREKLARAVAETDGMCMLYDGAPILAVFHSSSAETTEASGAIWGDLPYLQSVRTYESPDEVPGYYTAVALTYGEFKETILEGVPGAVLEDDSIPDWIGDQTYTASGRLESLRIGGVTVEATTLRSLFSLRSTHITMDFSETGMVLTTGGYGHGVGMSQYGANTLAGLGLGWDEILQWYYTDIVLSGMDSLL